MRRFIPLFLVLAAVVAVGTIVTRRRRITNSKSRRTDYEPSAEEIASAAMHAGIADVDPIPMTEVAGEGIDLDAAERREAKRREDRELDIPPLDAGFPR